MLVAGAYIFEKNLAKHAELIQHAHAAGWQLAGLGCRDASREKKKRWKTDRLPG
jgi:hypothetical protein